MDDTQKNTIKEEDVQVNDSVLLERMIKKVEREESIKEGEKFKKKAFKEEKADTLHEWLEEAIGAISGNTYLEPFEHKHNIKLHVGVFDAPGVGKLTRTYNIKVKVVNDEDEYMIEKINYDWRGLASSYHREIDDFEDLRDYFLKELAREVVFARKHEDLAVYKYPQGTEE